MVRDQDAARLRRRLLAWFARHRRDLPWRRRITPYRVLVSEIMLQQTVVSAVAPRFERWMKRFPGFGALAGASERAVLREWEGLGYYARARNLRRTAQQVMREHGGRLPTDYAALRRLPGVGDYTASAILSLVHDQPYPVLDANVRRVMMRYLERDAWNRAVEREARAFLGAVIAHGDAGAINEGLMELGEVVCRASAPQCLACPLAPDCRARAQGRAAEIPAKRMRSVTARASRLALVVSRGRLLIERRSDGRFLSGLWRLPEYVSAAEVARLAGCPVDPGPELRIRQHHYTRYRHTLRPRLFHATGRVRSVETHRWVAWDDLDEYPFPSTYRKILLEARALTGIDDRESGNV